MMVAAMKQRLWKLIDMNDLQPISNKLIDVLKSIPGWPTCMTCHQVVMGKPDKDWRRTRDGVLCSGCDTSR